MALAPLPAVLSRARGFALLWSCARQMRVPIPASRDLSEKRRALAPETEKAFQAFCQQVFAAAQVRYHPRKRQALTQTADPWQSSLLANLMRFARKRSRDLRNIQG